MHTVVFAQQRTSMLSHNMFIHARYFVCTCALMYVCVCLSQVRVYEITEPLCQVKVRLEGTVSELSAQLAAREQEITAAREVRPHPLEQPQNVMRAVT